MDKGETMNTLTISSFTDEFLSKRNRKFHRDVLSTYSDAFIITGEESPMGNWYTPQLIFTPWDDGDGWKVISTSVGAHYGHVWKVESITEELLDNLLYFATSDTDPYLFDNWLNSNSLFERHYKMDF